MNIIIIFLSIVAVVGMIVYSLLFEKNILGKKYFLIALVVFVLFLMGVDHLYVGMEFQREENPYQVSSIYRMKQINDVYFLKVFGYDGETYYFFYSNNGYEYIPAKQSIFHETESEFRVEKHWERKRFLWMSDEKTVYEFYIPPNSSIMVGNKYLKRILDDEG